MPTLGLIAGNRSFPLHVAKAARALGYRIIAVGLKEETESALEEEVDRMHWVTLPEIGVVPDLLKKEGVKEVILAGQIRPERLLTKDSRFDEFVQQLLKWMPDRSGSSAMKLAVRTLEGMGFQVLDSSFFLKDWIPATPGVLTRRPPTPEEQVDLEYGIGMARSLSRLGIGQTVVIRRKAIVAVEAMEGTDAVIRRAGEIVGAGCVVVKACGPEHDMRFDIPVVGIPTLQAMEQARAPVLGVEAKRTLLFDRPAFVNKADEAGISLVAV